MNSRMAALWDKTRVYPIDELPEELRDLLREGWVIGPANALLLKGLYGEGWVHHRRQDEVAHHECEVNDVWIPPDGLPSERDSFLTGMVSRARTFAEQAMLSARHYVTWESLTVVISVGVDVDYLEHGATVKLFTRRGRYPTQFEELERFQLEAMAVVLVEDLP
jgi:hypothetical protein